MSNPFLDSADFFENVEDVALDEVTQSPPREKFITASYDPNSLSLGDGASLRKRPSGYGPD